jgi:hypothetical protein
MSGVSIISLPFQPAAMLILSSAFGIEKYSNPVSHFFMV